MFGALRFRNTVCLQLLLALAGDLQVGPRSPFCTSPLGPGLRRGHRSPGHPFCHVPIFILPFGAGEFRLPAPGPGQASLSGAHMGHRVLVWSLPARSTPVQSSGLEAVMGGGELISPVVSGQRWPWMSGVRGSS